MAAASADISALVKSKVWERINSDPDTMYVVIGTDALDPKMPKALVQCIGDGGIDAIRAELADDQVSFVMMKVYGMDSNGCAAAKRSKYVFITWCGSVVSRTKKAMSVPVKAAIAAYFRGYHVAMEVHDRTDITEEEIEKRLRACGGAFQVNSYAFGTGHTTTAYTAAAQPPPFGEAAAPAAPAALTPADVKSAEVPQPQQAAGVVSAEGAVAAAAAATTTPALAAEGQGRTASESSPQAVDAIGAAASGTDESTTGSTTDIACAVPITVMTPAAPAAVSALPAAGAPPAAEAASDRSHRHHHRVHHHHHHHRSSRKSEPAGAVRNSGSEGVSGSIGESGKAPNVPLTPSSPGSVSDAEVTRAFATGAEITSVPAESSSQEQTGSPAAIGATGAVSTPSEAAGTSGSVPTPPAAAATGATSGDSSMTGDGSSTAANSPAKSVDGKSADGSSPQSAGKNSELSQDDAPVAAAGPEKASLVAADSAPGVSGAADIAPSGVISPPPAAAAASASSLKDSEVKAHVAEESGSGEEAVAAGGRRTDTPTL